VRNIVFYCWFCLKRYLIKKIDYKWTSQRGILLLLPFIWGIIKFVGKCCFLLEFFFMSVSYTY
jgi:hypothetical protein